MVAKSRPMGFKQLSRTMKVVGVKIVVVICGSWMIISAIGCTTIQNIQKNLQYNDSFSEWVIGQRNSAWAARAWHLRKHAFCNEKHLDDFCAGFRAGYMDVASGGNGCTPAFPPSEYWGWKYQSAEGQAQIAAWFSGYPHGARAAEEDGVGHFAQIQVSSASYNEYKQFGLIENPNPNCQSCPTGPAVAAQANSNSGAGQVPTELNGFPSQNVGAGHVPYTDSQPLINGIAP